MSVWRMNPLSLDSVLLLPPPPAPRPTSVLPESMHLFPVCDGQRGPSPLSSFETQLVCVFMQILASSRQRAFSSYSASSCSMISVCLLAPAHAHT